MINSQYLKEFIITIVEGNDVRHDEIQQCVASKV